MAIAIPTLNIDQLIASVMLYAVPVLIFLIVLGILFFFLRNIKWILIIGLLGLIYLAMTAGKIDVGKVDLGKIDINAIDIEKITQTNATLNGTMPDISQLANKKFKLVKLTIGKNLENGVVPEDRTFSKNDPAVFVGFNYQNADSGKSITTVLTYMHGDDEVSKKYGTVLLGDGYYVTTFPMPSEGWKVGTYSISVYYDGEKISESAFQVVE